MSYWPEKWNQIIEDIVRAQAGPLVKVIFIINGEDVLTEVFANRPIGEAAARALRLSHNTGRPPEEWEIRGETGHLLDPDIPPPDIAHFPRFFLSLRCGAGGVKCCTRHVVLYWQHLDWQFFGSR